MTDTATLFKVCTKCTNSFPATDAYWHTDEDGKYGLTAQCKECSNKARNDRRPRKEPPPVAEKPAKKVCTRCDVEKDNTEAFFYKHPTGKWGLNSVCKVCMDAASLARRAPSKKQEVARVTGKADYAIKPNDTDAIIRQAALERVLAYNETRTFSPKAIAVPDAMEYEPVDIQSLQDEPNPTERQLLLLNLYNKGFDITGHHVPDNPHINLYEVVVKPSDSDTRRNMMALIEEAATASEFIAMPLDRAQDKVAQGYVTRYAPKLFFVRRS